MALAMDGAELFSKCLGQATYVVKQVLPSHYANDTPDAEYDVEDLVHHMMVILNDVARVLDGEESLHGTRVADGSIDQDALDISARWQAAADRVEAALAEVDLEDVANVDGSEDSIEDYLLKVSGDILIHAWDLGEAIGMPVRFDPRVAETVMETTVVPNASALPAHTLFDQPISVPANADLQTRLLAIFGRTRAWRAAA
ncbi:MAG: hypothetical protein JWM81_1038 [Candidatus Saccharibacteria bacterium]|nr:hypothetical protein [Candidatus Saccharibacteria bacterium]